MFKKQSSENEQKNAETIIGPSVKVKGNFNGHGDIVLEGVLEGSLKTKGNVFIGDQAKISANIEAKNINIGGEINGNVKSIGHLQIRTNAKILGDIDCSSISIEEGALINGKISMGKTPEQKENNSKE